MDIVSVTEERRKFLLNKLAQKVVDLRLTPVAIVFLESSKPLSFIASQALVFFQPFYQAFFNYKEYDEITYLLEDRTNIEALILEIERIEDERSKK